MATLRNPSASDASCRILTIASSLEQAISFVDRIRNLSKETSRPESTSDSVVSEDQAFGRTTTIPWTLINKYYEADVFFNAREVKGLAPAHTAGVPAIIFAWTHGEVCTAFMPLVDHITRIANDISSNHPDVALAVRLPRTSPSTEDAPEDVEEDSEIDEFLSSHGFEFVDVDRQNGNDEHTDEGVLPQHDIPGLPRVLDSLSTVMWPSMKTKAPSKPKLARQRFNVFSRNTSMRIDSLKLHKEAEDLVRWLEDDVSIRELIKNDPWKSVSEPNTVCTSPTSLEHPSAPWLLPPRSGPTTHLGFDDDFSDFVSAPKAPSDSDSTPQARSPTGKETSFDDEALRSPFSTSLYRALGSASNLSSQDDEDTGDLDPKQGEASDDEYDELPSQQEIAVTAARIFGSDKSIPTLPHVDLDPDASSDPASSSLFAVDAHDSQSAASMQVVDLYDVGQFDLTRVLDALRGMKAEIASMSDEGERRRAAARVALGLVYGLEAESEELSDDSDIEGHPNVDHRSLVRWKQRDIHEKREMRKAKIAKLQAEIACNDVLQPRIEDIYEKLPTAEPSPSIYFNTLAERLEHDPSPDAPPTNAPGQPTYDAMLLSLLLQVGKAAKSKVGEAAAGLTASEKEEKLAKALREELKTHLEQLKQTTAELKKDLEVEIQEQTKHITSDDIHDGFESKYVPPKPAPPPIAGGKTLSEKPKKKVTTTEFEVLNPKASSSSTPQASTSTADPEDDDDEVEEDLPELTPSLEAFSRIGLQKWEQSFEFIKQHRDVVVDGASDALLVAAFRAQTAGKSTYAKQCVHQSLLLQYCEKIGGDGVGVFFKKMIANDKRATKVFLDDVEQTYQQLMTRVEAIKAEEAENSTGKEQIQLVAENPDTVISFNVPDGPPPENLVLEGPGTEDLDVEEVRKALDFRWAIFSGFPENLQAALKEGKLEGVNKVLGAMDVAEAENVVSQLDMAGILSFAEGGIRDETGR